MQEQKDLARRRKATLLVIVFVLIGGVLSVFDFLSFVRTGKSTLHPYLALFIAIACLCLFIVACLALRELGNRGDKRQDKH